MYFISATNVNFQAASGDCILLEKRDSNGKYHYGLIDTGNSGDSNDSYVKGLDVKIKNFLTEHMKGKAETVKSYNGATGETVDKYVLDFLIITHNDQDHIGNAAVIVDDFKFKSVYLKDMKYEVYLSTNNAINYTSSVLYGKLVAKIIDQNDRDTLKTVIYGLDDFDKYDDSKDFCTLDINASTNKNKIDDASLNAFAKTPALCRLLVYYNSSSVYDENNNVSFWLQLMRNIEKGVDYIPFSEMNSRSIDFGGATIDLFGLLDNELLTREYLTESQYLKYQTECPYYPYWPDYYDKTGNTLHSSYINENYSSDSKFYHYSNYYAKYDVYDSDIGKVPTHSGPITRTADNIYYPTQINENVRSISVLISVGSKKAVMAGDLMNYVRYAYDTSSPENYLENNFVYCGYEDALASAIAKKIGSSDITSSNPLNIDFVKMSHHGYWYSNTLNYMNKLRPRYSITTRNGNNENVSDLSKKLANGLEITATQDGKSTSTLLYPYGGKGMTYNYGFSHWYSIDDKSSMVVRMDEAGVSVYPESYNYITVKEKPNKLEYFVGESIDSSGLVLNAIFDWHYGEANEGKTTTVGVVESGYTITPSSFAEAGTKEVTVQFGEASTTYSVNVYNEAKIGTCSNLTYTGSNQTLASGGTGVSYQSNSGNNVGDYEIVALPNSGYKFKDGSTAKSITCSIKQASPTVELSKKSGTVYIGNTLEFSVDLNDDITYSVVSSNSNVATATKSGNKVIVKGIGAGTANISIITDSTNNYKSVTKFFEVNVSRADISSISISKSPNKVDYYVGDNLDVTGMKVYAKYDDGSETEILNYEYTPKVLSESGTTTVTVTYSGKSTTFTVNVKKVELESISINTMPTKTSYYVGDSLDTSGLSLKLKYNNGSEKTINSGFTVDVSKLNTSGQQVVTVTYSGKSATFTVNVKKVELESISINTMPKKTSYYVGDSLDTSGLSLKLKYNNSSENTVTSGFTVDVSKLNTSGQQVVTVTYSGKSTTFTVTVEELNATGISIKSKPKKLDYYEGDSLDVTGLEILASYNNGSTKVITSSYEYTPKVLNASGTTTVTVTYSGKSATFTVTVKKVELESISINTLPGKTNYYVGDSLDTSGLSLKLKYNNGSEKTINSGFTVDVSKLNTSGQQVVTVTYSGKSATFTVNVKKVELESISINTMPKKTSYYVGDSLDTSGLSLKLKYNNSSENTVTSGFTVDVSKLNTSGQQVVTVTYSGKSATFTVNVKKVELESISINTMPKKTSYYVGDSLDTSGLSLKLKYNNSSENTVTSGFTVDVSKLNTSGQQVVTVTYSGKSTTFTVTVEELNATGISIKSKPKKLDYYEGDSLDVTGLEILASYNNGSTKVITSSYEYTPKVLNASGTTTVTVTYSGKSATFTVNVGKLELVGIVLNTSKVKTDYYEGDNLDVTGLEIIATYSDSSKKTINEGFEYTPKVLTAVGSQDVEIAYGNKKSSYKVNVKKVELESINVKTSPNKLKYYVGDTLSLDGLVIEGVNNNGTKTIIDKGYTCDTVNLNSVGTKTVTIKYGSLKTTFDISVEAVELESISIKENANSVNYYKGDKFDSTGLVISLNYNNGKIENISKGFTTSISNGTILNDVGSIDVLVSYKGFTTSYNILVEDIVVDNVIIKQLPDKINYVKGDKFDSTGLVLTVINNNLSKLDVSTALNLSISDGTILNDVGTKKVSVDYEGHILTFDINIKEVKSIEVKDGMYKGSTFVGDKFNLNNIILYVEYTDGTFEEINSGFDTSVENGSTFNRIGEQTIKLSYGGISTDLSINVTEKSIDNPNTGIRVLIDIVLIVLIIGHGTFTYNKKLNS